MKSKVTKIEDLSDNLIDVIAKRIVNMISYNCGLYVPGNFDVSENVLYGAIIESLKSGRDVLYEYRKLHALIPCCSGEGEVYSGQELDLWNAAKDKKTFWNIYSIFKPKTIEEIDEIAKNTEIFIERSRQYETARRKANAYLANKKIRESVFKRDGYKCKKCGKKNDLSIDHIVSIFNGGKNELKNLQVLCRSCNSKKGKK